MLISPYIYYFRATSLAPLCLVRSPARCYCADRSFDVLPLKRDQPIHWGCV
jgi:hypothetical protein